MQAARLLSIHIGKIAPLGPEGVPSGIVKHPIEGSATVMALGIAGDEQADLSVHGGPEKAVYGYGVANYADWRVEYPQYQALLTAGGMGENLAIEGLVEADLCVGDVHRIGSARLQVCQPRQPCSKFALVYDKYMPKAMVRNGRSGWYYRVLEEGVISPGDAVATVERPNPHFSFARLVELISRGKATLGELEQMATLPGLASQWQGYARLMLDRSA